ncbi:FAD-dependent oxidoreductase [Streptomyces sp. WELS2]|uniref:NAD(P)/FAD-dependent oxidoreductase n=1 Tax=Streptomyces sp. WELS2 TaxID=2749435 RepID=UPI0015F01404|nr:FAD-dependent oxidoreductase [Streptomyces sp. WELS2]
MTPGDRPLPRHIAVVGAGLAGVSVCAELRRLGYEGALSLFGEEDGLPYDRPPLSKDFLLTDMPVEKLWLRPERWYEDNDIDLRLGESVTALHPFDGRIELARGSAPRADLVVLATGGRPRPLNVPGGHHRSLVALRSLDDAHLLKERLRSGAEIAVVGGGLIGAEVAASARALGCSVTVVEPADPPLEHLVGRVHAAALHAQHQEHGVRVLRTTVDEVVHAGARTVLRLADGTSLGCDLAVVGVGLEPETSLAASAGLHTDRGIVVDAHQRTSHWRMLAVGDAARGKAASAATAVGHWHAARTQAAHAAAGALGLPRPEETVPWFWSERYGTRLEAAGQPTAGTTTVDRGSLRDDSVITFALVDGRCVGAVALNRPREMAAARRLIGRGAVVDPVRLADPGVDLRSLVPGRPRTA